MRAVPWLCVDGTEVANEARTLQYVSNGLIASGPTANADCACESISDGPYISPATDDAPWYTSSRPESGEYLGIWAHTIRILSTLSRSSRQRQRGGARIGRNIPTQRIVQVEGLMFAATPRGMAYGERWLEDVLGEDCHGCVAGEVELLPACPDGLEGAISVLSRAEAYYLASNWSGTGTMADLSGNGHTATPTGTVTKLDHTDTQYLYFPGDAGSVRADDAPYISGTGDKSIRIAVAVDDWTPAADNALVAKWDTVGNQRSWLFLIRPSGALDLLTSTDGAVGAAHLSTATTGFTNGTLHGLRADLDVDDGAGNHTVRFYTRSDLVEDPDSLDRKLSDNTGWTQLGTTVTTAGTIALFDSTAPLEVGNNNTGAASAGGGKPLAGKVYIARVATETTFSRTNLIADLNATNTDNVVGGTWGDGINKWSIESPAAPDRPIVLVDRDFILMDTNGYFEIPDHADLDFASSDSPLTIAVAYKHGPLPASDTVLFAKKTDDATAAGYLLLQRDSAATRGGRFTLADGTNRRQDQTNTIEEGALTTLIGVRKTSTDQIEAYKDSVGSATATPDDTAILSNGEVLRIGRLSGAASDNPSAWMFSGAAIFREELSPAELYVLAQELKGDSPRGQQYVRTLRQVGVVDAPEYDPWGSAAECKVQTVSFQLGAGIPQLLAPPIPLLDNIDIPAGSSRFIVLSTQEWVGDAAGVITLEALEGNVTDLTITARITLDGTCVSTSGGPPCLEYEIASLPLFHRLTIDAVERKVVDLDPTMKRNVSGLSLIAFDNQFDWLEIGPCSSICLTIANAGAVTVRASVDQVNREN